jgi:hypothetical protein
LVDPRSLIRFLVCFAPAHYQIYPFLTGAALWLPIT